MPQQLGTTARSPALNEINLQSSLVFLWSDKVPIAEGILACRRDAPKQHQHRTTARDLSIAVAAIVLGGVCRSRARSHRDSAESGLRVTQNMGLYFSLCFFLSTCFDYQHSILMLVSQKPFRSHRGLPKKV